MKIFLITAWSLVCVGATAAAMVQLPVIDDAPGQYGRALYVREIADAKACRLRYGEATFARNFDGRLVCIPRRGPSIVQKDED